MKRLSNVGPAIGRRGFISGAAAIGGTVLLGFDLRPAAAETGATSINAWIAIMPDNRTIIQVSQAEMGQGIHTTFPAIIADEMDADWDGVTLEMAPHDPAYFNPEFGTMFTGNAESTRTFWQVIRRAGAAAREMLIAAAADRWNVDVSECRTAASMVHHDARGAALRYADLVATASTLPVPASPRLKTPDQWRLLRRSLPRRELRDKVTGGPIFGLDAEIKGMVYAAIRHADTVNGAVARVDRGSVADMPGVLDVVELPGAVAVVATSTWRALKAADRLSVVFQSGERDGFSSASLDELFEGTLDGDQWTPVSSDGDAAAALETADLSQRIAADYHSAWQAHAPMEPMNCIADVRDDRVYILAPTQGQTVATVRVAAALGVEEESIHVERTFLGGGFGRRLIADYAVQAALISKAVGRPVQLVWNRTEDMRADHFRPHVRNRLIASVDEVGLPVALDQRVVSPTILSPVIAKPLVHLVYPDIDPSCVEGLTPEGFLYDVPHHRVRAHMLDQPVPTMVWRTTGYGPNVFAVESFVDELATRTNMDPLTYRIALLRRTEDRANPDRRQQAERAIAVLQLLQRTLAATPAPGNGRGIAFSHCFETFIAQAVDVSVDAEGTLDLHHVTTVLDGGFVLDPDITEANIEGGVYWGLTQALTSQITFEDGAAMQSNFHDFEILTLPEAPSTSLHYIDSGVDPGGLGEVGPVATAPALANAIAAATGRRLRTLPLSRHGIYTRYRKQFLPPDVDPSRAKL